MVKYKTWPQYVKAKSEIKPEKSSSYADIQGRRTSVGDVIEGTRIGSRIKDSGEYSGNLHRPSTGTLNLLSHPLESARSAFLRVPFFDFGSSAPIPGSSPRDGKFALVLGGSTTSGYGSLMV